MREELMNNQVTLEGEITSGFEFDHDAYGEGFYLVYVAIPRTNGVVYDHIPCLVSERLVDVTQNLIGCPVKIQGQFRSYNEHIGEKARLLLRVFVRELEFLEELYIHPNMNVIRLSGYICKTPIYRKTPFGREIADILLAVNRPYRKSDYIPCICWGRNARFASEIPMGELVHIKGRIQSREYRKKFEDGTRDDEVRIAYEVSVGRLDLDF
jgi:single-stranded DNA-binding protein